MQDSFYSGLKTQEIQIINHTIQYLNQDFFLTKITHPAHPDFLKPIVEHPNIRNSVRCLLIKIRKSVYSTLEPEITMPSPVAGSSQVSLSFKP